MTASTKLIFGSRALADEARDYHREDKDHLAACDPATCELLRKCDAVERLCEIEAQRVNDAVEMRQSIGEGLSYRTDTDKLIEEHVCRTNGHQIVTTSSLPVVFMCSACARLWRLGEPSVVDGPPTLWFETPGGDAS